MQCWLSVWLSVRAYQCTCVYKCICACVCVSVQVHDCASTSMCMSVHTLTCTCVYTCIRVHEHTSACVFMWRPLNVFLRCSPVYFLRQGHNEPEAHQFSRPQRCVCVFTCVYVSHNYFITLSVDVETVSCFSCWLKCWKLMRKRRHAFKSLDFFNMWLNSFIL